MTLLLLLACNRPLPDLDDAHRDLTGALPVFPGAEGFGTDTPAGRGGQVIVVDTLAADGAGSLKAAVEAEGPRTIVFAVGGVIGLTENLRIDEPFVTIAGQTAPEPGITITGAGLEIRAHDVLVQHLRVRPGDDPDGPDPKVRDAVAVVGEANGERDVFNVVIDHCSLSWGVDETFSTWYRGVRDVTLRSSLVTEALDESLHPEGGHGKGVLIGDHTRRIALLDTVLAYNADRNPFVKGDASALIANVYVHDPGRAPVALADREGSGPALLTVQGAAFTAGPDTPDDHPTVFVARSMEEGTAVYLEDVASWDVADEPWAGVDVESARDDVRVDEPPVSVAPLTRIPAVELKDRLLPIAGARPGFRDAVDERVIAQLWSGEGGVIDSPDDVGGLPDVPPTSSTLDVPPDPGADTDGDGYTDVEEWLHGLAAAVERPAR